MVKTFENLLLQIRKIVMQHQGLKFYKVYINDDTGLTLTYFTARSSIRLNGENCYEVIKWGKLEPGLTMTYFTERSN